MHPPAANLDLYETMLNQLETYLLSGELFWPLSAQRGARSRAYPRLALGGMLLLEDEMQAQHAEMTPADAARYDQLRFQRQTLEGKWLTAMRKKASREAHMRLGLWRAFAEDLGENPGLAQDAANELRQRTMLQRLLDSFGAQALPEAERAALHLADSRIAAHFKPGRFVWDAALAAQYPREKYAFLYWQPRKK